MEKIVDVVKLMAKTGVFFANADGCYSNKEEQYLGDFLSGMQQIGDLDDGLRKEVADTLARKYSLDEVLADTRGLLEGFSNEERTAILAAINAFIGEVVRADGQVHPLEEENYKMWKRAFGLA